MSSTGTISPPEATRPWVLLPWANETARTVETLTPASPQEWRRLIGRHLPFVVRGMTSGWAATQTWNFQQVARRVGARTVPLVRVHDGILGYGKHSGMDYQDQSFGEFAQRISDGGGPEWFLNLNPDESLPELAPDLEVPACCERANWRERRITMAASGTTTPLHRELPDNMFTVLHGVKELALFAPGDSSSLYPFGVLSGIPHLSAIDPRRDQRDRFPKLTRTTPYRCRLRAGDALLIPRGWWHTVHTVESSIALGSWWATGAWSLLPRAATLYKRILGVRT